MAEINEWLQWISIILLILRSINDRFKVQDLEYQLKHLSQVVYEGEAR